uniref:RING-type E3 ubiquitin transferase n=1 Tax=Aegilops tauschii subsp. strangulata TaxID=200361 RepID=A0A453GFK9_AEGTS
PSPQISTPSAASLATQASRGKQRRSASTHLLLQCSRPPMAPAHAPGGGDDVTVAQCPICMEELVDNNNRGLVTRLPGCLHSFHESCIAQWFCRAATCPCCRRDMPTYSIRAYPLPSYYPETTITVALPIPRRPPQ